MLPTKPLKPAAKKVAAKPASMKMGINLTKTHRTANKAINMPSTSRSKWNKMG